MAKKVVTLYIDDNGLSLLEVKGKRVKKWASVPLEPGLVQDGVVLDTAELADKIRELLKAQKVRTKKAIVGLSGLHCLSRVLTVPKISKDLLAKAVSQEAERTLSVPLDQLYLSWQVISSSKEEMQIFVAAVPCNTADSMIEALRQADMKPYLMDLKPLALTRAVQDATAVIVDIQKNEFDLVIMVDGIPHPIRTVPFPSELLPLREKLAVVKEELERTIKFYNSSFPDKPLESDQTIFISGELADSPELCRSLLKGLGYPVLPLLSSLKCPENLAQSQYMVNIGLALKELSPGKKAYPSLVNLNVLPEVYQPKPISSALVKILLAPVFILMAIGLLIPLAMMVRDTAANTALLQVEINATNQLVSQKRLQQQSLEKEIAVLESQITELKTANDTFTAVLDSFSQQQGMVNGDLRVATSTLPDTVNLSDITHTGGRLTIRGTAPSEAEVLTYASSLRASDRFSAVIISSIEQAEDGVTFALTLSAKE